MQDEEKYIEIRNKLKNLPRIKASENFENLLKQKINLAEADLQKEVAGMSKSSVVKKSLFEKVFAKKSLYWSVPAFGSVVVILILLMIYNSNRKTELVPGITGIQTETTTEKGNLDQPNNNKTEELNSDKDKITGKGDKDLNLYLNENKEKKSSPPEMEKGYFKKDITIPSPAPAPPTMRKNELELKKVEEVESSQQPIYQENSKTEKKSDEKISPEKSEEKKSVNDEEQIDLITVPANKNESGKEGKVKAMEKKKVESKVNRAIKDSTDTIKKELEKIRDSILEKEKNK